MIANGIKIISVGGFLPDEKISNQDLLERFNPNIDIDFIQDKVGIKSRHFASDKYNTSDLAFEAARNALENANLSADKIERIILATTTPDHLSPATACKVQKLLGATCPSEDKNSSCSGFIFGLDHAIRLIQTGINNVILIGSDIKSRFVRKNDNIFLPIFADGAGAIILSKDTNHKGFLGFKLWSDGKGYDNLYTQAGGSAMRASIKTVSSDAHSIQMFVSGREIFESAVTNITELILSVCDEAKLNIKDIDVLIPHQANLLIIKEVINKINFPVDKTILTIDFTGNTVNATLPYAYYHAKKLNKIKPGQKILFVTVGSGYSGGACIYEE